MSKKKTVVTLGQLEDAFNAYDNVQGNIRRVENTIKSLNQTITSDSGRQGLADSIDELVGLEEKRATFGDAYVKLLVEASPELRADWHVMERPRTLKQFATNVYNMQLFPEPIRTTAAHVVGSIDDKQQLVFFRLPTAYLRKFVINAVEYEQVKRVEAEKALKKAEKKAKEEAKNGN